MVSGAEHAAIAELRAGEWKCALLVRRSVADAYPREEGKTTGMEVSLKSLQFKLPTQLPTYGRILGV